jgi:hypothetical protein
MTGYSEVKVSCGLLPTSQELIGPSKPDSFLLADSSQDLILLLSQSGSR